jgi:hypothetical protein
MPDGLRNHEIAEALRANERALRDLAPAVHRVFSLLDDMARDVRGNTGRLGDLERQVAELRSAIQTLTAVQQTLTELRRDEINLERDKVEKEITGEVARVEAEAKARADTINALRDGARGFGLFLQTRSGAAVLFLCGMIVAWGMGTTEFANLATSMLGLLKGVGWTP